MSTLDDRLAIRAESLSKRYPLGTRPGVLDAARGAIGSIFRRNRRGPRGEIWALNDVSFEVERGEAVGIIGANGAGKSTLLRILSRITEPTRGHALTRGRVGSLLEVGTGFHPELTGRENIFLNGAMLGMRRQEIARKLDEIIAFAEVEKFVDTPVKRYSSGMYVRLAFAVAAHLDADILLVDEVLAVGDLSFQRKCLGKMQDQTAAEGRTVLFVSHNLASIKALTQRSIWLDQGRIRSIGTTDTVFRAYVLSQAGGIEAGRRDLSDLSVGRLAAKSAAREVTFDAIALRTPTGDVTEVHLEGEPLEIDVDLRCRVQSFNRPLEVIVRMKTMENVLLFAARTGLREVDFHEGVYRTSLRLDPNPLTAGVYEIGLFTLSGYAQDLVPNAMKLRIEANPSPDADGHEEPIGLVRVDYAWGEIERVEAEELAAR